MNMLALEDCYSSYAYTEINNLKEMRYINHSLYHLELLSTLNSKQDAFYSLLKWCIISLFKRNRRRFIFTIFQLFEMYTSEVHKKYASETFISEKGHSLLQSLSNKEFRLVCGKDRIRNDQR